ncbi:MAG: pyruvate kinase [Candidatus Pacearchaeota archaeon]
MKTKIIATIGKKFSYKILKKMKNNGMDIARINTKYGNIKQWENMINILKKLKIEIMIDIKNLKFIDWINSKNINYIAVSYARDSKQIKNIKNLIENKNIKIISKIETKEGIKNIDDLINISDGIMVARGDLSKNIKFEKVPYYKKLIIDKCRLKRKFVIVATEMLLSMVHSRNPTNAEVEDVFSAVLIGANALMLSEETAIGNHPVLCVKTMKKIISYAEHINK